MGSYLFTSSNEESPSSTPSLPKDFNKMLVKRKSELKHVVPNSQPPKTEWQRILAELRLKIAGED